MVEVHTAAIIPPKGMSVGDPAAFVAAAFGGMAAPLFVMISGWGIYMSASRRMRSGLTGADDWASWTIPRVVLLASCQIMGGAKNKDVLTYSIESRLKHFWYSDGRSGEGL